MAGMTIWVRITLAAKTARVRGMAFLGVMRRATLQGRWVDGWVGGWESDRLWVKIWQDVCCCVASFSHTESLLLHRWLSPASLQPPWNLLESSPEPEAERTGSFAGRVRPQQASDLFTLRGARLHFASFLGPGFPGVFRRKAPK